MKETPSPSRWRLLFCLKDLPAVLEDTGSKDYPGEVKDQDGIGCIVSFPGKYQSGWTALIEKDASHGESVACVFLCTAGSGLGEHIEQNPGDPASCYCREIYGKKDYKQLGYLKKLPADSSAATLAEEERKAKYTKTVIIREGANDEEIKEAEEKAEKACKDNHNRASWGCAWFEKWKKNVEKAWKLGQKLKVVFFLGQVGQGKVAWKDLPIEDLWNGVGCGGSQKSEIAYLEKQGWEYTSIDALHFLRKEFQIGKEVIAWDDNEEKWISGKIVNIVKPPQASKRKSKVELPLQFLVESKKGVVFVTHQVRHGNQMQDFLKAVGEYPFLKMVDQTLGKNAEVVGLRPQEYVFPDGEVSGPGF